MIEFKKITLDDKEIIQSYLDMTYLTACDYGFSNLYLWRNQYKYEYSISNEFLIIKTSGITTNFLFPIGDYNTNNYLKDTIFSLLLYAKTNNIPLVFTLATKEQVDVLKEVATIPYTVTEDKDHFDYVYESQNLAQLEGKKYHQKRNHLKKFLDYDYDFSLITKDNVEDCIEMNRTWCKEHNCKDDQNSAKDEYCVVKNALKNMDELDLEGALLKINNIPVAFCVGSKLNEDTFVIHIEKALVAYNGVYPAINNMFAVYLKQRYKFINREDDLGIEGLRKAKLSYHPSLLIEKYTIKFKEN